MWTWRTVKRLFVLLIGGTVLLVGVAAIFLPVLQAWLIIPLGLGILATEFIWARRLLDRMKQQAARAVGKSPKPCEAPSTPKEEQAADSCGK